MCAAAHTPEMDEEKAACPFGRLKTRRAEGCPWQEGLKPPSQGSGQDLFVYRPEDAISGRPNGRVERPAGCVPDVPADAGICQK